MRRPLAVAGWALLALTATAWTLDVVLFLRPGPGPGIQQVPLSYVAIWAATWIVFAAIGAVIVGFRPANRIGWALLAVGFLQGAGSAFSEVCRLLAATPRWHGVAPWLLLLGTPTGPLAYFLIILVLMLFPDGRLPSRRWRWVVAAMALVVFMVEVDSLVTPVPGLPGLPPSPLANPAIARVLDPLTSFDLIAVAFAVGAVALVVRYRSGSQAVRQQVKWFGFGTGILIVTTAVYGLASAIAPQTDVGSPLVQVGNVLQFVGLVAVPAGIAIAILRYRLYDIDLIISRALAYGALAAAATALYVAVVVGIGALLGRTAGRDLFLALVATAVVAVAFQPLRIWLQSGANRLVYGRRQTPYESLSGFTRHLADSYLIERLLPRMAEALGQGTRGRAAAVMIGNGTGPKVAAAWPDAGLLPSDTPDHTVPIVHQGKSLGSLVLWSHQGEDLNATERRLLSDLALQAGLVVHNASLAAELEQRLEELQASRLRLVTAQDAERRRLERDLHDGAQHDLVAFRMKLGLAEALAAQSSPEVVRLIAELREDTAAMLENIRRLGRGLYPPLLESQGLAAALTAHSRRLPIPVEVRVEPRRFPPEAEAAVYFCCVEALQNTAKHAAADRAWLTIEACGGELQFEVGDDGRGIDRSKSGTGSGLQNIGDRVEALGGRVSVRSGPTGTLVRGALPVVDAGSAGVASAPSGSTSDGASPA